MVDNTDVRDATVDSREAFGRFLALLQQDLMHHPAAWENTTLTDFLGALSSYTKDIQGHYDNASQPVDANQAHWQVFADIMKGARVYE